MAVKVTVSRDDLVTQIAFHKKQNNELIEEIKTLKSQLGSLKPANGEMKDYIEVVVKDSGGFRNAKLEWNLETNEAKVTVGNIVADAEFRAEYEGRKYLSEYLMRKRGEKV